MLSVASDYRIVKLQRTGRHVEAGYAYVIPPFQVYIFQAHVLLIIQRLEHLYVRNYVSRTNEVKVMKDGASGECRTVEGVREFMVKFAGIASHEAAFECKLMNLSYQSIIWTL
jgi:hypothetical protein